MARKKQSQQTVAAKTREKRSNSKPDSVPESWLMDAKPKITGTESDPTNIKSKTPDLALPVPSVPDPEPGLPENPIFIAPKTPVKKYKEQGELEKSLSQSSATDFGPPPGLSFSSSPPTSSPLTSPSSSNEGSPEGFKRCHTSTDDNETSDDDGTPTKKAKLTATPLKKANIAEENILLLSLKDEKNMKWPDIVEAFRKHGWAGRKQTLLKNRYRSLKEGIIFWEDDDVDFLHQAIFEVEREYERTKWDKVAERIAELGASRKFQGAACERKFRAKALEIKEKGAAEAALVSEEPATPADVAMS